MHLYTRPRTGVFYADALHPGTGKRIRFSTGQRDRRAAQEAALSHLKALQDEAVATVDGSRPIALDAALSLYLDAKAGRASHANMTALSAKLRSYFAPPPAMHEFTPAMLQGLVSKRQAEGLKPQTIAHEIGVLRAAMRYVAALGYRVSQVMLSGDSKQVWRVPTVPQKTRYLTAEELAAVLAYLDPAKPVETIRNGRPIAAYVPKRNTARYRERQDAQDIAMTLAFTGARWSEVTGLTWGQIAGHWRTIRLWGNKSQKERLVGVPPQLKEVLQRRCPMHGRPPPSTLVFPGRDGRRGASSLEPVIRAMDACGLNDPETVARHGRATVHSLRHTYASLLLQRGAGLRPLQEALGHSRLATTQRYTHLEAGENAERLSEMLTNIALPPSASAPQSATARPWCPPDLP